MRKLLLATAAVMSLAVPAQAQEPTAAQREAAIARAVERANKNPDVPIVVAPPINQVNAQKYNAIADALAFFWGSRYAHWTRVDGTDEDGMENGTRIRKTDDPCVVRVDELFVSPNVNGYGHKITTLNFRKVPAAKEFVISDSPDYHDFTVQAEAKLIDGAICQDGVDGCWKSWRMWDGRGGEHIRRRLMALDHIRNKFCS
jgi:hypothetical protein